MAESVRAVSEKAGASSSPFFISVVVVNYNGRRHLERCLPSLAAQTHPAFEIIVVDNASTDDSLTWMADHFPDVQIIRSARNLGFAEGNNLGFRAARGELIATLNNDAVVEPDYLARLAEPMRDPHIGLCAALMLEFERRERIDAAGIRLDRAGFAWNNLAGQPATRAGTTRPVWGACAGAALYRRAMLEQVGGFDPDYFAFYEDVDLAWRARQANWTCVLVPDARAYHVHGGSFARGSARRLYLLARNRWWTQLKNRPLRELALYSPLILGADLAALAESIVRYRSLAPGRGRLEALRSARAVWAKRRPGPPAQAIRPAHRDVGIE